MKRSVFILAILLVFLCAAAPQPASAEGDYDPALQLYYQGNYAEAVKYLKEYVEKKPDPSAYYLIGYGLYELGRFSEANEYFEQAYLIDPTFSPEESGLTEKFPTGLPRAVKKPAAAHKKRAAIKKKKAASAVTVKQAEGKKVAPAGEKKTVNETAQVTPPAKEVQAAKPEPQMAATPQQKAAPPAREVMPRETHPPAGPPTHPLPQKDMKRLLPFLAIPAAMGGLMAGFAFVFLVIGLAFYLYVALCLFLIAKKRAVPSPWTAWIPLVQLWTFVTSAGKPWWWILLLFIPLLNIFVIVYLWMCISENLGRNKWLGLLWLVPLINLVFIGFLAFSKTAVTEGGGFEGSVADEMPPVEHEDEF